MEERSWIISGDIFRWANGPHACPSGGFAFRIPEYGSTELAEVQDRGKTPAELIDVLFLDPPYRFLTERPDELRSLMDHLRTQLSSEAICIFRHDAADSLEIPGFVQFDLRDYGQMRVEFLQPFHRPATRDTILP